MTLGLTTESSFHSPLHPYTKVFGTQRKKPTPVSTPLYPYTLTQTLDLSYPG
ncbi:hypothetical protein [Nostoc sp. CENA543]|uniref:hypothetical protein n=1 Tax=Nostoc sp. CENA543 TaxID=1869241 RepID=UPI0012FFE8A4|nr:hypothetical protein [Nostoc sp. CENA543]